LPGAKPNPALFAEGKRLHEGTAPEAEQSVWGGRQPHALPALKLTAINDTALVFTTKGKTKEVILAPLAELEYLETTPVLVSQLGEMGVMVLVLGQIPLIASPFIGLLESWQKAGEAAALSGMLAGGGLLLFRPCSCTKCTIFKKNGESSSATTDTKEQTMPDPWIKHPTTLPGKTQT
jgi:hypothetical protein